MARWAQEGNRRPGLFQSLLRGLANRDSQPGWSAAQSGKAVHMSPGFVSLHPGYGKNQLFSSGLISFSKSSKVAAPLTISPLMKKLGVEFTFSTSLAYF
jgi:hypothetical protein